jgi:hypothetical protein
MRATTISILFLSLALFSCKNNKQKLVGSWHSVRLENRDIDSFFVKSQLYIDTIGKNNDPATNMEVYGTTNVDSLRKLMQEQYDSAKTIQMRSVTNTVFNFTKDSLLYISFNGNIDTCKWGMDGNSKVRVEDLNTGGTGEKMTWEIMELTDTDLVLKIPQDSSFSKVTFHPEKP